MTDTYYGYRMISQQKTYLGTDYCKVDVTKDTPTGIEYVYAISGKLTMLTTEEGVKSTIRQRYRINQCAKCAERNDCEEKFTFINCKFEAKKCPYYTGDSE